MRIKTKASNTNILLFVIIVFASILRLYNLFEIPYTNDELSAIFRADFSNFSDLIKYGVLPDGHPAGIQVFLYYYIQLFGTSEWAIKLPFIIAGILSVYILFVIGKKWYNETVGLIAAAFLASIQFAVMYSQIARPYATGLLFALLMVNYWSNVMLKPNHKLYKNLGLFVLFAAFCAYNHHFSFLFAGIVGITGLFIVQRKFLKHYFIAGIAIIILYLPHVNVFFKQLSMGGIESWLGKPGNDFIFQYLYYIFQFSYFPVFLSIFIIFLAFFVEKPVVFNKKFFVISFSWFLLPFLIGFFYSIFVSSVIQFSVLIFSFPFLFFMLFGHIPKLDKVINTVLVLLVLSVNTLALVFERNHYDLMYKSHYENFILEQSNRGSNTLSIIDSRENMNEFYLNKHNLERDFISYGEFEDEVHFIEFLTENHHNYDTLYFGAISLSDPLIVPVILNYFPHIYQQNNYFTGTSYLFTKDESNLNVISKLDYQNTDKYWSEVFEANLSDSVYYSDGKSFFMDSGIEWSPSYRNRIGYLINHRNNYIDVSVRVLPVGNIENALLVSTIDDLSGANIDWRATEFAKFITNDEHDDWITIKHTIKLSDIDYHLNNVVNIFIWNTDLSEFYFDDFKIILREGNPDIYGAFEPI